MGTASRAAFVHTSEFTDVLEKYRSARWKEENFFPHRDQSHRLIDSIFNCPKLTREGPVDCQYRGAGHRRARTTNSLSTRPNLSLRGTDPQTRRGK